MKEFEAAVAKARSKIAEYGNPSFIILTTDQDDEDERVFCTGNYSQLDLVVMTNVALNNGVKAVLSQAFPCQCEDCRTLMAKITAARDALALPVLMKPN